jgi:pimeloyl-ACP methyl ester carboxylesterase
MVATNGNVRLHYESTGSGPPILLVMGLGRPAAAWWRTVPVLAQSLSVIAFDNRGSGRSDRPLGPYSIADMAADAVAVLDAAGVEHAHVYGISMGGMIAQEVVLRHPDRVRSLVLGATSPGGAAATPPDADTSAFLQRRPGMPAEEGRWASVRTPTAPGRYARAAIESPRTSLADGRPRSTSTDTAPSSRPP